MSLIEIPKNSPLESAPLQGEIIATDLVDRTATVNVAGQVVDGVTWFGDPPAVGSMVHLIDTGDRLIVSGGGSGPEVKIGGAVPTADESSILLWVDLA